MADFLYDLWTQRIDLRDGIIIILSQWLLKSSYLLDMSYRLSSWDTFINCFAFFLLQLDWETHPTINGGEARSSVKCSHKYLKVVEIAGYYGGTSDFELAMYFIENAVALDKVVIDPCCQHSHWIRSPESTKCEELAGRSRAYRQFQGKVPMGVELVLLWSLFP